MDEVELSDDGPVANCTACGRRLTEEMAGPLGLCRPCWSRGGMAAASEVAQERLSHVAFGKFAILGGSVRGGMGTVYRARRLSDGTVVALKVINAEHSGDEVFRERFRREAAALEAMKHPHVVRLLDHGEEEDGLYLAMEWIGGGDLRAALKAGPLPPHQALKVFRQTAQALIAAHKQGIIHRDIKPGNILLDESGAVKVADFGLVQIHGQEGNALTTSGLLGGAYYSAPELLTGSGANERTDIFSLGVLLYHLLTGQPPQGRYLPARKVCPGKKITRGLDRMMDRAMAHDPAQRFTSVLEMLGNLDKEQRLMAAAGWRRRPLLTSVSALLFGGTVATATWWQRHPEPAALLPPILSAADQAAMKLPGAVFIKPGRVAIPLPQPATSSPPIVKWENSLGMKFIAVPGTEILMCQWETRVREFRAHAQDLYDSAADWLRETKFALLGQEPAQSLRNGIWKKYGANWLRPGWEIDDEQPVAALCFEDAAAFCTWLTWKERRSGQLKPEQAYRLPTDAEWSAAAGLPPEALATPQSTDAGAAHYWPWGPFWPPPPEWTENYAGQEFRGAQMPDEWTIVPGTDAWPRVAPATSGKPSPLGFYHLSGNLQEWTETRWPIGVNQFVLRGANWAMGNPRSLCLTVRVPDRSEVRMDTRGFRVVFQPAGSAGWRYGEK